MQTNDCFLDQTVQEIWAKRILPHNAARLYTDESLLRSLLKICFADLNTVSQIRTFTALVANEAKINRASVGSIITDCLLETMSRFNLNRRDFSALLIDTADHFLTEKEPLPALRLSIEAEAMATPQGAWNRIKQAVCGSFRNNVGADAIAIMAERVNSCFGTTQTKLKRTLSVAEKAQSFPSRLRPAVLCLWNTFPSLTLGGV